LNRIQRGMSQNVEGTVTSSAECQINWPLGNINSPQQLSVRAVDKDLFRREVDIAILILRYSLSSVFSKERDRTVPAAIDIGIRGVRVVVGIYARSIQRIGAVAAEKAHIVHQGIRVGHPQSADSTAVDTVGVEADAGDNIVAAMRRDKERNRRARSLKRRRAVGDDDELRHRVCG
jgi:hypothetical protein